jgi:hypothetical protein
MAKRPNRVAWRLALLFSGLLLLGWLFRDSLIFYWTARDWGREKAFDAASFTHVAHEILSGRLNEHPVGLVVLPQAHASLTADGRVYVTRKNGGLVLILFPTWRGKGSNLEGYLFCSRRLKAADIQKDSYTQKAAVLRVKVPQPITPSITPSPVGEAEVRLERKINGQWYEVAYGLD